MTSGWDLQVISWTFQRQFSLFFTFVPDVTSPETPLYLGPLTGACDSWPVLERPRSFPPSPIPLLVSRQLLQDLRPDTRQGY